MIIEIPSGGCFYATSSSSFNHVVGSQRTYYYLPNDSGQLVKGQTTSSYNLPNNVYCLESGDLIYKPEVSDVVFPLVSILIFVIVAIWWIKLMFRGWQK